jgi:hypothetical protein
MHCPITRCIKGLGGPWQQMQAGGAHSNAIETACVILAAATPYADNLQLSVIWEVCYLWPHPALGPTGHPVMLPIEVAGWFPWQHSPGNAALLCARRAGHKLLCQQQRLRLRPGMASPALQPTQQSLCRSQSPVARAYASAIARIADARGSWVDIPAFNLHVDVCRPAHICAPAHQSRHACRRGYHGHMGVYVLYGMHQVCTASSVTTSLQTGCAMDHVSCLCCMATPCAELA